MITEIVSYDGTVFAPDYEAGFVTASEPRLPSAQVQLLERIGAWPVIVALQRPGHRHALIIRIVGADRDALRSALFRLFDPEDEMPKTLVGRNHNGIEMSVEALCEDLRVYGDQAHDTAFVVTLAVDGDVRWRATTATSDTWNITASGQTHTITNPGEDETYPLLEITPTAGKTGGFDYKRYALVTWRAPNPGANYAVRLGPLDTAALVTAGKMQSDGDDLYVYVDGTLVPRWLVAMDDANTYIWFNANYQPAPTLELAVSIAGAGSVDSIALDDADEMAKLPERGFVRIGNEVFSYGAKDVATVRLTDIERAVWSTAAGAHNAGDDVFWMQHEVVLAYGNATAATPSATVMARTEPVFTLATSDNTSWVYDIFGNYAAGRSAKWQRWGNITLYGSGGVYTATEYTTAVPFTVAGAWLSANSSNAYGWFLENPCGIVNAAWASGKKRAPVVTDFLVHLMYWIRGDSWWSWQATLADPANPNAWEAWSESAAAADWEPADVIAIAAYFYAQDVEAGQVTVSLNTDETPVTTLGSELGNYTLAATVTNEITGEAIVATMAMAVNETLAIDTDTRRVTYELDGSNQFQAVTLDTRRRHWLRLLPGDNVIRFDDTGTDTVTIVTALEGRYY